MKKQNLIRFIIALSFTATTIACGSGVNSDAKKAADLACRAQKMAMEMDINNTEELTKLQQEATALYQELAGKYQSSDDMKKFTEAYQNELSSCK